MNFPLLFFFLSLLGMLVISVYEVIRAASLRQWERLGCLTSLMLVGVVLFGFVLFFRGFFLFFEGFVIGFFALFIFGGVAFLLLALSLALRRRRWKSPAAIGVLALSWYICVLLLAPPQWSDGDIVTYEMDDGRTCLGRELSSGTYIGLISEDVVSVGSDENWIVVEQRNSKGENPQFYILPKSSKERWERQSLKSLTPEEFEKEVIAKSLPAFSWHKKQTP